MEFERRYSAHTLVSYRTDLAQFQKFLAENFPEIKLAFAGYTHIRPWLVSLIEKKISPRSVNRKTVSLRSFYKFLIKKGVIEKNPTLKIQVMKTKKQLPSFVQETDISQLLDNHEFTDDFAGWRDKLILEMLYGTGIRLSELMNLKTDWVSFYERTIKVLGKRNKERVIPFSKGLSAVIEKYIRYKKDQFGYSDNDFLLVTDKGEKCYPVMIYRVVNKYLSIFTTLDKRSPHVLRHTFATHLLNKGADLNAVKDLLGHTSLAATQVYTHNSMDKLKKVFEQAHPKA